MTPECGMQLIILKTVLYSNIGIQGRLQKDGSARAKQKDRITLNCIA